MKTVLIQLKDIFPSDMPRLENLDYLTQSWTDYVRDGQIIDLTGVDGMAIYFSLYHRQSAHHQGGYCVWDGNNRLGILSKLFGAEQYVLITCYDFEDLGDFDRALADSTVTKMQQSGIMNFDDWTNLWQQKEAMRELKVTSELAADFNY